MKKLFTKIRHKLIRALGGEIPVPIKKPLVIRETVPLTIIKAVHKIPTDRTMPLTDENLHRSIAMHLENEIGKEIVKACGVQKNYNAVEGIYTFSVTVEVTERSLRNKN